MAENLEPINIDINLNQNVASEADKASAGMNNMTTATKALEEHISAQKKTIADLEKQYTQANKAIEKLTATTEQERIERKKAGETLLEVFSALNEQKTALADLEKEHKKLATAEQKSKEAKEKASNVNVTYASQMRLIREEMQGLRMAGKEEGDRYKELQAELQKVGRAYKIVSDEQRQLTTASNATAEGIINGLSGLAGGFSAAQGIASLFVKDNEKLAAIQTKLQSVMAITIGLQQVSNVLNKTSAFQIEIVSKVTNFLTAANARLAVALGISTVAAQALMATLTLGLSVAIMAAVVAYNKWSDAQKEKIRLLEEEKKFQREVNRSVGEEIAKIDVLEKILKDSNRTYKERNSALEALKSIMHDYNAKLTIEGKLIEENTGATKRYINQLLNAERAKRAVVKVADAKDKLDELNAKKEFAGLADIYDSDKAEDKNKVRDWIVKHGASYFNKYSEQRKEIDADLKKWGSDLEKYTAKDIVKIEDNTKAYWEQKQKTAKAQLDALKDFEKGNKEWIQAEKEYKEASKKLETWNIKGTQKQEESEAAKALKLQKANILAMSKDALQRARSAEDMEIKVQEAQIGAMNEGGEKVLAQMELNHKKEKLSIERQQEDLLRTKRDNAKSIFEADANNKGKLFDESTVQLSETELKQFQELQLLQTTQYEKEKYNLELSYMRDYISQYGTYQEKKLAIAQEYDKKIANSSNEWERKALENKKQTAISGIDFEAINKQIDWQAVFGNMTGMLESQLKETLDGLKEYVKTDQFKSSSDTDKKTVYEAIERLTLALPGGDGTLNFSEIRKQMDDLGVAINTLQKATVDEKNAYDNLLKAQQVYDKALQSGNQEILASAQTALASANHTATQASEAYREAETNVESLGNQYQKMIADTTDGLYLVSDGLNQMGGTSLPSLLKGLQNTITGLSKIDLGNQVNKVVGNLADSFEKAGGMIAIIGAVLSILDVLKDGIGTLVSSLIDTVLNAVDGILKDALSGEIVTKIGNSLVSGTRNILNTVSLGGFNSLIGSINGGNAKETADTIARLTTSNEALKVSVDALKNEMAGANGAKSIDAYNKAVDAQKRYEGNMQDILNAQMKYSSAHHSNSYYWKMNKNSLNQVNELLDTNLNNSWNDFAKLTADEMNEIRTNLPDIWTEMINQGKYGDRFKDDWNNYADQAGKVAELTESLRENIAQISFSSLRDSFVSILMDMDSDASTFADNFSEYMTKSLLNFAIGDMLDTDLKAWYDGWTDTMNTQKGKLTDAQIEDYRQQWEAMAQMGLDKRDEIAKLTGYTGGESTRTGAKAGIATASQDSINELNGGIYALRQQIGDIRNIEKEQLAVQKATQTLLSRIAENTEYCKYLADVKRTLEDIQVKGVKLKV